MSRTSFSSYLGFTELSFPWSIHAVWSTTDPTYWVIKKNKLQPEDLMLLLSINDGHWVVTLTRRDERFQVQWRAFGISVESAELRYRKLIRWPIISSPIEVPHLVANLSETLSTKFARKVNIYGSAADELLSPNFDDTRLQKWLSPSADDWSVFGQKGTPPGNNA